MFKHYFQFPLICLLVFSSLNAAWAQHDDHDGRDHATGQRQTKVNASGSQDHDDHQDRDEHHDDGAVKLDARTAERFGIRTARAAPGHIATTMS